MGILLLLILVLPWKLIFLIILASGSFIAISASSWLIAWIGLEINMLALLGLLINDKSPRNSEATLKYFLIQALASAILISRAFRARALFSHLTRLAFFSNFIILRLFVKVGAAPFHGWIPQIIEGLTWINNGLVLTWQKVAPFILISSCLEIQLSSFIVSFSILSSALIGALIGLNQSSTRKILAFSSINHIGWMLARLSAGTLIWIAYFVIYSVILLILISLILANNINSIAGSNLNCSKTIKVSFFVSLLSFGGLPPFLGFLPKWFVITNLIASNSMVLLIIVMTSLVTLFFYSRIAFSAFLLKREGIMKFTFLGSPRRIPLIINLLGLIIAPIIFIL